MAWTEEQLSRLREAMASGELSVQYEDKRVTYRSLAEMAQIEERMARELEGGGTGSLVRPTFRKGL